MGGRLLTFRDESRPFVDPALTGQEGASSDSHSPSSSRKDSVSASTPMSQTSTTATATSSTSTAPPGETNGDGRNGVVNDGDDEKRKKRERNRKKPLPHSRVKLGTGATIAQWTINECVPYLSSRGPTETFVLEQLIVYFLSCRNLSLVALLRPHAQDQHSSLIDYNVSTFRKAVLAIFDVGTRGVKVPTTSTSSSSWTT